MKRFAVLIGLELKKSVKTLPKLMAGAVILLIIIFSIAFFANGLLNEKQEKKDSDKISIGVVCYDESKMMDLAKGILMGTKSVTDNINLVFVDEKAATEGLYSGKYMAVMVIPDEAIKHIISGKNTPIEIRFPENAGYEAAVFKEIADAAVNLLAASQAGVYSVYDFYNENNRKDYIKPALDRLNDRYIKTVLLREKFFRNTTVVATGELEVMEYYLISGLILFMFLFGINSITFRENYKKDIINTLCNNGVGVLKQTFAGFTGMFLMYMVFVLPVMAAIGITLHMETDMIIRLIPAIVPAVSAVCAIILLVQTMFPHKPSAVLITFMLAVYQSFVTGGLIPEIMLPEIVKKAGRFTPAYYMIEQIRIVYMKEKGICENSIILLIITAAVLGVAAAVMKYYRESRG